MKLIDGPVPGFTPRKSLGQNFLIDQRVILKIVDACGFCSDEEILEIGPGQGALTRVMRERVRNIVAVETDRALADRLAEDLAGQNVQVHHADFLEFDLSRMGQKPFKVVGNIPYNISTPIIARVIENRQLFSSLMMTVQLEFGARLVAAPGSGDYSSLSCFVQMFARPKMLFKISPAAFRPAPKVMSCFMQIDLRESPAYHLLDEMAFVRVVRQAFQQRRKNLLNSLAPLSSKEIAARIIADLGMDFRMRAENVTIGDYARIANAYTEKDLLSRH